MIREIADLARLLKSARTGKRLSQRELSERAGVPQAHISKIENGAVDLRVSSLLALARVLELELTLVPRKAVPAVQSIVRSSEAAAPPPSAPEVLKELRRLRRAIDRLPAELQVEAGLVQLKRRVQELEHVPLTDPQAASGLRRAGDALRSLKATNASGALRQRHVRAASSEVERLRKELMRASATTASRVEPVRPAYSLDEEDDAGA